MNRFAPLAILTAAFALGAATSAPAQVIHRSGSTFHVEICPGPDLPGQARCHAHVVTDGAGRHLTNRFGMRSPRPGVTPKLLPAGYAPADLRAAYNISASGSSTTTIAIVDAYGYTNAEADLGVYRSTFGLPPCTSANGCFAKYNELGQKAFYPRQNVGWADETALDLDMASTMCPNCTIILVEANSASYGDLADAENTAARLGANVISNSYGGGEQGTTFYESAYNHPGVAITVSSGDEGYGVQFPASSPHVTAVGGTSLYTASNARGWTETAWVDGGSGCSSVYAKPTWQTDPLCGRRMEADVSAVADPNTGVAVYAPVTATTSAWEVFGGTSVAAPLVAGVYAVSPPPANYKTLTFSSLPYANASGLNDITTGSNGRCGGTYFCTAGPGYDGPTGLGTPNGTKAF